MPIAASPDVPRGLPLVFVPGLNCTADLFEPQIAAFRDRHPIIVADHASDETIADIARRLLAAAPPKFALIGLSMGGYVALEVMRQAPQRVAKLALIDTRASQDVPGDTEIRQAAIKMAETGRFDDIHPCSGRAWSISAGWATRRWRRSCAPCRTRPAPPGSSASRRPSWRGPPTRRALPPSAARR